MHPHTRGAFWNVCQPGIVPPCNTQSAPTGWLVFQTLPDGGDGSKMAAVAASRSSGGWEDALLTNNKKTCLLGLQRPSSTSVDTLDSIDCGHPVPDDFKWQRASATDVRILRLQVAPDLFGEYRCPRRIRLSANGALHRPNTAAWCV
jgi:hypothetical protein